MFARFLLAALITASLGGCSWSRTRVNIENFPDKVANLEPGKTTAAELVEMVGAEPWRRVDLPDDKQMYVYFYGDSKSKALTLIIINIAKTNTAVDSAYFVIDSKGIVEEAFVGRMSEDLPWQWWAFGG